MARRGRQAGWTAAALAALLVAACAPPWNDPPDFDAVFHTRRVSEWRITVEESDWLRLIVDPRSYPCQQAGLGPACGNDAQCPATCRCEQQLCVTHYVPADVEIDGRTYPAVGLRVLGNRERGKLNLRLRFNELDSAQRFHGFKRINLRANRGDPTQIREALALGLLGRAELPAPRFGFGFVRINGDGGGLYTLVQQVDRKFLLDRLGEDEGPLYQIEDGGTLVYQGDDPAAYQPPFERLYEVESDDALAAPGDLIQLMRVLEQAPAAELPAALDLDLVLRLLAVNTWLSNLDAYPGTAGNLYLYRERSGAFTWIPGGQNRAFGNYHGEACRFSTDELIALDFDQPTCGGPRPLVDRLLADPDLRASYHAHLQDLQDSVLLPASVLAEMQAQKDLIADWVAQDALSEFSTEQFEAGFTKDLPEGDNPIRVPGLQPFIEKRDQFLREFLQ